jgi:hypothetical protein
MAAAGIEDNRSIAADDRSATLAILERHEPSNSGWDRRRCVAIRPEPNAERKQTARTLMRSSSFVLIATVLLTILGMAST